MRGRVISVICLEVQIGVSGQSRASNQYVDDLLQILQLWEGNQEWQDAAWIWHQFHANRDADADVALAEQTIDSRTHIVLEYMPRLAVRQSTCAGSEKVSVRQDDFHTAMAAKVVPIGCVTAATVHCVAQDASSTQIWHV